MARNHDAYNTTDGPVVVTDEGHMIGGREHGKVDPELDVVKAAVESGSLILADARRHPEPADVAVDAELELPSDAAGDPAASTTKAKGSRR